MIQIQANNFFNLHSGSRMPGSGKENQDVGALREPADGLRDNDAIGLSGSDVGANGQISSLKRATRSAVGGANPKGE